MKIHIIKNNKLHSFKITKIDHHKSKTRNNYKSKLKKFFACVLSLFCAPIITAYLADYLIEKSLLKLAREEKINMQIDTLENIYIGCSKEWIDDKLGVPTFTYTCDGTITLIDMTPQEMQYDFLSCIYVTDLAVCKVYFEKEDLSCQAFYITSINEKYVINLPSTYKRYVNNKPIGDFSYYDIYGSPTIIGGGISNGNLRTFYGETFYYNSAGNYYNFIFGNLDYGIDCPFEISICGTEIEWDDKTIENPPKVLGMQNIKNRKENIPNTFGLSTGAIPDQLAWTLLYDSRGFDSFQLKKEPFYYLDDTDKP
ncbi:ETEC_3214 domain-containing protein [Ruminococcus sp.]|jgi:hypothetical protein|uniref:ETEC_3214 domain-containing protein n=1 Tax=Ruminococcus sp. TaxID=41978 RepID=UPI0025F5AED3|nr:ETEC_3214 domain-containing protein [Ruminococcus sp.]